MIHILKRQAGRRDGLEHKDPGPTPWLDQSIRTQRRNGFSHHGAADAVHLGQTCFAGQLVPDLVLARENGTAQRVGNLYDEGLARLPAYRVLRTHLIFPT